MKCSKCLKEDTEHLSGLCLKCFIGLNEVEQQKLMIDTTRKMLESHYDQPTTNLKVQFFEGKLIDIQRQMNKFFEDEKITRERLVEIKFGKSIMVVYN